MFAWLLRCKEKRGPFSLFCSSCSCILRGVFSKMLFPTFQRRHKNLSASDTQRISVSTKPQSEQLGYAVQICVIYVGVSMSGLTSKRSDTLGRMHAPASGGQEKEKGPRPISKIEMARAPVDYAPWSACGGPRFCVWTLATYIRVTII